MAKLKDIKGSAIQYLAEDPVEYVGTWSSGGSLNTARGENFGNGVGTQTAAAVAGGATVPGNVAVHEQYDGTSWTETTDINTAREGTWADGTQPAFWVAGGGYTTNTETWNGSAWTEVNNLNTGRSYGGGTCGRSSTAGLVVAGYTGTANTNAVESWDGTNWTEIAEVNSARRKASGFGTSTAAFAIGAAPSPGNPGLTNTVESWNGSSWTETTEINSGRGASSGAGTTTDGLIAGSEQSPTNALTENWNGTTWTEVADLGTARGNFAGSGGTGSVAWAAGGTPGSGYVTNTEEWNFPPSTSTILQEGQLWFNYSASALKGYGKAAGIPAGSWGSAGNLNTGRGDGVYGFGTTSAAGIAGGDDGTPGDSWVANTEIYDGSSWTEVNDLNTARYFAIGSGGTTTAAIGVAGRTTANVGNTETWNGSTWTETTDINTARRGVLSNQPPAAQTQILVYSGYTTTALGNTESWDGTSWTELSDLNTVQYTGGDGGAGPSDAIAAGGQPTSPGLTCEFWDGTSWTEGADTNNIRVEGAASGATSTSAIYGGGNNNPTTGLDTVEYYNGTSWTEIADLADGGNGASHHIGSAHDTFFAGGITPATPNSASTSTEHFTASSAVSTVTTS
jgi:hypothetical protein